MPTPTATPHVVKVRHVFERERATMDESGLTVVDTWQVETDDQTFPPLLAMFAVDPLLNQVPDFYSANPNTGYGYLKVINKLPERVKDSPYVHNVYVTYGIPKYVPPEPTDSKWNIDIKVRSLAVSETVYQDINGNAIVNSAANIYSPGLEEIYHDQEVMVSFYASSVDQAVIDETIDHFNTDEITLNVQGYERTFEKYSLRFSEFDIDIVITPTPSGAISTAIRVQLTLHYRRPLFTNDKPWNRKIPDMGFYELDLTKTPPWVKITDSDGSPISTPVALDGMGQKVVLPAGTSGNPSPPISAVIYDGTTDTPPKGYQTLYEIDFTALLTGISV